MLRNDERNPRSGSRYRCHHRNRGIPQQSCEGLWGVFPTDQGTRHLSIFFVKHFWCWNTLSKLVFHHVFNFWSLLPCSFPRFLFYLEGDDLWLEGTIYVLFLDDSTKNLIRLDWERYYMLSWNWYIFWNTRCFCVWWPRGMNFPFPEAFNIGVDMLSKNQQQQTSGGFRRYPPENKLINISYSLENWW